MNGIAVWALARRAILAAVLLAGLSLETASTPVSETLILERLSAVAESLELALFLTKTAILSPSTDDVAVNLQEVLCLLTGPGGAAPGSCAEPGILGRVESILLDLPTTSFDLPVQSTLLSAIGQATGFLTLAVSTAQQSIDELRSSGGWSGSVRTVYAYLSAAMGVEDDTYTLGGIQHALAVLPNQTIWVRIGDSILDAIDAVLPGGTIYIEPGTHRLSEGIVISKSLTVARSPGSSGVIELVIPDKPYASLLAVSLPENSPSSAVTVEISDLHLAQGDYGITVRNRSSANLTVRLSRTAVVDCDTTGIRVEAGQVHVEDCTLEGNGVFGLTVAETADVALRDCRIAGNGMSDFTGVEFRLTAGVRAAATSTLSLDGCTVQGNRGPGLFVESNAALALSSCRILDHQEDGVRLWDASTLRMSDCKVLRNKGMGIRFHAPICDAEAPSFVEHYFAGEVSGSGNIVPAPGEEDENLLGDTCPSAYDFLLMPPGSTP